MTNFNHLTANDDVSFYRTGRGVMAALGMMEIVKVNKVTKTQITLINGMKFNMRGKQIKSPGISYPTNQLCDAAHAIGCNARTTQRHAASAAVHALKEALDGRRNGHGDYPNITPEMVEMLNAATAALVAPTAND